MVTDSRGLASAPVDLTLQVVPLQSTNEPPFVEAFSYPGTAFVDSGYRVHVPARDPDGDPLVYEVYVVDSSDQSPVPPDDYSITDSGWFCWDAPAEPGQYTVGVAVHDSQGGVTNVQLPLTVLAAPSNAAPEILTNDAQLPSPAAQGRPYRAQILAADPDGDVLEYSAVLTAPDGSQVAAADYSISDSGLLSWDSPLTAGLYVLAVRVSDGWNPPVSKKLNFEVQANSNRPPVIDTQSIADAAAGLSYRAQIDAHDDDGNPLEYSLDATSLAKGLAIDSQGRLSWSPTVQQAGLHQVTVTVSDQLASATRQYRLTVTRGTNAPPQIHSSAPPAVLAGQEYRYLVQASDPDGDPIRFELELAPTGMSIDAATGLLRWQTNAGDAGSAPTVRIKASEQLPDGQGGLVLGLDDVQSFSVAVTSSVSNRDPQIVSQPDTFARLDRLYGYDPSANDPESATLLWSLPIKPTGMLIDQATGRIRWQPTEAQIGTHTVTLRVSDLAGGSDTQSFSVTVRAVNRGPQITSVPETTAWLGRLYTYAVRAADPEGDPIRYVVTATDPNGELLAAEAFDPERPGQLSVDASGVIRWQPTAEQAGTWALNVIAKDPLGAGTQQPYPLAVRADSPEDQPPVITSTPVHYAAVDAFDAAGQSVDFTYEYQVQGRDPDSDAAQFRYSLSDEPPYYDPSAEPSDRMRIDVSSGLITWQPSASQLQGLAEVEHVVTVVLSSGARAATQRYGVRLRAENHAPQLQPLLPLEVTAGRTYRADLRAADADRDPLQLTLLAGPAGLTMDGDGRIAWPTTAADITPAGQAGSCVEFTVADPLSGTDTGSFQIRVLADTQSPVVDLRVLEYVETAGATDAAPVERVDLGDQLAMLVSAVDNVCVETLTLSVIQGGSTQRLVLNADGLGLYTPAALAPLLVVATATDSGGNTARTSRTIYVNDPGDSSPPSVELLGPADGTTITTPRDILGKVFDADGNLASWTLTATPLAGGPARTIASQPGDGIHSIPEVGDPTPEVLGTFDPTLLANAVYVLTLSARDLNGRSSSDERIVRVEGGLKLGNLALSFVDLELPVPGLPLTVTRSYDSLQSDCQGDFGYGWRMDLTGTQLDFVYGDGPLLGLDDYRPFVNGTRVIVTLPDGTREGFSFYAQPSTTALGIVFEYLPTFVPDPGVKSTLSVPQVALSRTNFGDGTYLGGSRTTYSPLNPLFGETFTLTLRNGNQLVIGAGSGHLAQIVDRLGNTLTFTGMSIDHSAGRSIRFERDWNQRITAVIVPDGTPNDPDDNPRITYAYDLVTGDLTSVTDRSGATVDFVYRDDRPHYLQEILDPLGRPAARTEFYPDGRVKTVTDADGMTIDYNYDPAQKTQTLTDQLGHTTVQTLDDRGNILREQDPVGGITLRSYDGDDNLLAETIVVGLQDGPHNGEVDDLTTRYTYDTDSNLLTTIDPRGRVSGTAYNEYGQPLTTTDQLGNQTHHAYDDRGLLAAVRDAGGNGTAFDHDERGNLTRLYDDAGVLLVDSRYNAYGEVISSRSAAGSVTYFDYDVQGTQIASWYFSEAEEQPFAAADQILDITHYDGSNRVIGARRLVLPDGRHVTAELADVDFSAVEYLDYTLWTTGTHYDATGQVTRTTDQQGNSTETTHDLRGQSIQTRTGTSAFSLRRSSFLLTRTVYDAKGRAILTTDSFVENPGVTAANESAFDPATGSYDRFTFDNTSAARATHSVYDAADRVVKTLQVKDVTVRIVGDSPSHSTQIAVGETLYVPEIHGTLEQFFQSRGVIISSFSTEYDNASRVTSSFDQYGTETRTTYNRYGEAIETRSVSEDSSGNPVWLVSRTVYDSQGRVELTTDRYELPYIEEGASGPSGSLTTASPPIYATRTVYDDRGRVTQTQRLQDVIVSITDVTQSPEAQLQDAGVLVSTTRTIFNAKGQVSRSIAADGQVTDYQYDSLGRQTATIGHAVPADSVALPDSVLSALGPLLSALLVRHRTETDYDDQGRVEIQRTNVIVVETADGTVVDTLYGDAQKTTYAYDAFGNRVRTTYADGSYSLTRYDDFGRQRAEMQQVAAGTELLWSDEANSFVVPPSDGSPAVSIPTKLYEYDAQGRLAAVILPAIEHPDPAIGHVHPRYEYTYDSQGNLVGIRDNVYQLGSGVYYSYGGEANDFTEDYDTRRTWFTFDDQGHELTRTLPLGVDQAFGAGTPAALPFPATDAARLPFTEYFAYNDLGQQTLHVSFEGVVPASSTTTRSVPAVGCWKSSSLTIWTATAPRPPTGRSVDLHLRRFRPTDPRGRVSPRRAERAPRARAHRGQHVQRPGATHQREHS